MNVFSRSRKCALLAAGCFVGSSFALSEPETSHSKALFPSNSHVQILDAKTFHETVQNSPGVWLVQFYTPWCGYCQQLAPDWSEVAKGLNGVVNVAVVNCDENYSLAQEFGIQGFPTIKIFGSDKQNPSDYFGPRTTEALVVMGLREAFTVVGQRVDLSILSSADGE